MAYQSTTNNEILIEIDDVNGRQMIRKSLQNGNNTIDVKALIPGTYFYEVYEGNSVTMKGMVVKQ